MSILKFDQFQFNLLSSDYINLMAPLHVYDIGILNSIFIIMHACACMRARPAGNLVGQPLSLGVKGPDMNTFTCSHY